MNSLVERYGIEPISSDPWVKGFTGGSDDHAGLFIGQTVTRCSCSTRQAFIQQIKDKKSSAAGRCSDYKTFAFSIYKIFCDYSLNSLNKAPGGMLAFINNVVFEERQSRLRRWITKRKIKKGKNTKNKILLKFFDDVQSWSRNGSADIEEKLASTYNSMGLLLDEFFKMLIDSFMNDFAKGDIGRLFRNLMSSLPALFISVPFFSALRHLSQDRDMIFELREKYRGTQQTAGKKVLWFTDTLDDLNGVSVTLSRFRKESIKRNLDLEFVTCSKGDIQHEKNERKVIYLPVIHSITPDFYPSYTMRFPSLLASMEIIHECRPDHIVVSTPGPVGILGLTMAGVLGIECVSIYHTDFGAQALQIFEDEGMAAFIDSMIHRFYTFSSQIKVPTEEYINILEKQDFPVEKMSIFKRGFEVEKPAASGSWIKSFKTQSGIKDGFTLMWAGRVSKDKNVDFLFSVYLEARRQIKDLNLVLCGDGPDFHALKKQFGSDDRVHFKGRVEQQQLQLYYEISDLFVFPSTTDTFGMLILESQAKGLPAVVSDVGGPQEIIDDQKTGFVLSVSDKSAWIEKIVYLHRLKVEQPNEYAMIQSRCRNHIQKKYHWDDALADILGRNPGRTRIRKTLRYNLNGIVAAVPG